MADLNEDIKAAIAKNLSAEVGEALRKRLAEATALESHNRDLRAQVESLSRDLAEAGRKITLHKAIDVREGDLAAREKALFDREVRLLKAEASLEATVANQRAAGAEACVTAIHKALAYQNAPPKGTLDGLSADFSFNVPFVNPQNPYSTVDGAGRGGVSLRQS